MKIHFRVSYKISATDNWERNEDRPERFQCPPGIGDPGDFCYDLSNLQFGIQYTADVSAHQFNSQNMLETIFFRWSID